MNSEKNSNDNSMGKIPKNHFLYDFAKITGALPSLIFVRPKVILCGKNATNNVKGGALIVSNHVTYYDPIIIFCAFWRRRVYIMATKELYNTKLSSFYFRQMHCIPVDRDNFSMSSFRDVTDRLNKKKLIAIFPEGQVNRDTSPLLSFKTGAVIMAHKAGANIIPMYIVKREKWYKRQVIMVGEPINVREVAGEKATMADLQKASEYVKKKELELAEYYQTNIRKKSKKEDGNVEKRN